MLDFENRFSAKSFPACATQPAESSTLSMRRSANLQAVQNLAIPQHAETPKEANNVHRHRNSAARNSHENLFEKFRVFVLRHGLPRKLNSLMHFIITLTLLMIINNGIASAYESNNFFSHYMVTRSTWDTSWEYTAAWRPGLIVYYIQGNKKDVFQSTISNFFEFIGENTGLTLYSSEDKYVKKLEQGGELIKKFSGVIYINISDDIFIALETDHRRFADAGFSAPAISAMVEKFHSLGPGSSCMSGVGSSSDGYPVLAYLLSDGRSSACIKPALYEIFGITNIDNEANAELLLCVLYRARDVGARTISELRAKSAELIPGCALAPTKDK